MGMDASFTVDGEYVDAYKCDGRYRKIHSVEKTLSLSFTYETGYGEPNLYVMMQDVDDQNSVEFDHFSEPNQIHYLRLSQYLPNAKAVDVSVVLCFDDNYDEETFSY